MSTKIDSGSSNLPNLSLVFGYIAVKELPTKEQIRILTRLEYGNKEIATICGISTNTVAVMKNFLKKGKSKNEKS